MTRLLFAFIYLVYPSTFFMPGQVTLDSFVVMVDNLRVRNEPGLGGSVATTLEIGHVVRSDGTLSEEKAEVELRGRIYESPFIRIRTGVLEAGWVYAGAVMRIARGELDDASGEKIKELVSFLDKLDPKTIETGRRALDHYRKNFSGNETMLNTAASVIMLRYFQKWEGELWDVLDDIPWPEEESVEGYMHKDLPKFAGLRKSGFKIGASEGVFYPLIDWNVLKLEIGGDVEPSMAGFLDLQAVDGAVMVASDAALVVPIEVVGDMAVGWEQFNRQFPGFVMTERARDMENKYKLLVLTGMDNSPAFSWNGELEDNFRSGWIKIVEDHPSTDFALHLRNCMESLDASDGKKWPAFEKELSRYISYDIFF